MLAIKFDFILFISQALLGTYLDKSNHSLSGFGFLLILTCMFESMYFRSICSKGTRVVNKAISKVINVRPSIILCFLGTVLLLFTCAN